MFITNGDVVDDLELAKTNYAALTCNKDEIRLFKRTEEAPHPLWDEKDYRKVDEKEFIVKDPIRNLVAIRSKKMSKTFPLSAFQIPPGGFPGTDQPPIGYQQPVTIQPVSQPVMSQNGNYPFGYVTAPMNSGMNNQNSMNSGMNNQNSTNSAMNNQNSMNSGMNNQNSMNSGMNNQNSMNSGVNNQNSMNSGINNQNSMNSGTTNIPSNMATPVTQTSTGINPSTAYDLQNGQLPPVAGTVYGIQNGQLPPRASNVYDRQQGNYPRVTSAAYNAQQALPPNSIAILRNNSDNDLSIPANFGGQNGIFTLNIPQGVLQPLPNKRILTGTRVTFQLYASNTDNLSQITGRIGLNSNIIYVSNSSIPMGLGGYFRLPAHEQVFVYTTK